MQAFLSSNDRFFGMTPISQPSRLQVLRKAAGLTQRELATLIGQHHSNVGFWEVSGKMPPAELLPSLAQALGVSVDDLLGITKKKTSVAPAGKARLAFEAVSRLPRKQQEKILDVVNALVAQHQNGPLAAH